MAEKPSMMVPVVGLAVAVLAYTILLYAPWPAMLLAPVAAGIIAGVVCASPARAFLMGLVAGLLGLLLAMSATGAGLEGFALIAGIAGPPVLTLSLAFHTLAPALAGYLAWPLAERFGGRR